MRSDHVVASVLSLMLLCGSQMVWAQESVEEREDAMFGGEPKEQQEVVPPSSSSREDAMFGGASEAKEEGTMSKTVEILDKISQADDELAIGGFLFLALQSTIPSGSADDLDMYRLASPNLVDLYLDARPNPRVRAFIQGRFRYDYTIDEGGGGLAATSGLGDVSPTFLQGGEQLTGQLDQLWVKFDMGRVVYVTLGRQRVRWGASRFWNPTDFLNNTQLNPLALFDQRLGVDLLKLHLPVESLGWNFYAVGILGGAATPKQVGAGLRAEILIGQVEVALSFVTRKQQFEGPRTEELLADLPGVIRDQFAPSEQWPKQGWPLRFGADLSTNLGPVELRVESALTTNLARAFYEGDLNLDLNNLQVPRDVSRETSWFVQTSAGGDLQIDLNDEDQLIVGAEYFYNQLGYEGSDLYPWLLVQGALTPLYLGRHYGAMSAILVGPGSWNDTSFTLSGIGNLSDRSFLARLDYSVLLLSDLRANLYGSGAFGEQGEFFFGLDFPGIAGGQAISIPATRWTVGGALRMEF